MTEQEYRSAPGINKSTLWNIRRSPAHYKFCLENPQEDTPAMKIGRAVHAAILTPEEYPALFAILPEGIDRRTKAGKEQFEQFTAENAGKEILAAADGEFIEKIVAAFNANPAAVDLLKGTDREKPVFWDTDDGFSCKCRVDAMTTGRIIDLKTATDAETDVFSREALRYGYHVQAAHYIDAYQHTVSSKIPDWYFIVIEKTEPFCVNILKADIGFLDYGFIVRQQLLDTLRKCEQENDFPGYGENELCLPAWVEA